MSSTLPNLSGYDPGLPADVQAETTIVGAIMIDNMFLYEAAETLAADDFSLDSLKRIFNAMIELSENNQPIDIITLSNVLARHKELDWIGGVAYLASLTEGLPRRPVIREYVRIVKDKALARRVMTISAQVIARAADQSETAMEIVGEAIARLEETTSSLGRKGREIAEVLLSDGPHFEAAANAPMTGILGAPLFTPELSRITCGIQEGELAILAARPGLGKTEAGNQVIVHTARRGLRVHVQSLEMKAWQLTRRMQRFIARVPVSHMRDPRCLTGDERRRLSDAREELLDLPIFIDDTHEITVSDYRSRCVLAAKRWKADLIVMDYAQLLLVPRAKNAVEEAKKQAETLRHVARDYCRTLALAQLRRTPPNDLNRYPDIEDILGSSAFEQAAQLILLLHRTRENKTYTGEDFCFIGKMRELQTIQPLGIRAESWGEFVDRYEQPD